jgi:hypothetical protein
LGEQQSNWSLVMILLSSSFGLEQETVLGTWFSEDYPQGGMPVRLVEGLLYRLLMITTEKEGKYLNWNLMTRNILVLR